MKTNALSFLVAAISIATSSLATSSYAQDSRYYTHGTKKIELPTVQLPSFKNDTLSITKYGAVNDGSTLNTASINRTIEELSKKGGGVVLIPRGLWLTGPIELKSNINLHLQRDAMLLFTSDLSQYKLVKTNWEGLDAYRNQSPISGSNLENIAITGYGIIDGNGDAWRMVKKDKLSESNWKKLLASGGVLSEDKKIWYPTQQSLAGSKVTRPGVVAEGRSLADHESVKDFLRPNLLVLANCKKILLEGVTFQNSPAWNVHPLMSEDLTVRNIQVKNPWYAQNGDGIDIESCKNVLIENSVFDVGDDGLCIKSGRDEEGRKRAMPTENVIIKNCVVYAAHGGFVVGSEMSGGARNIFVSDCTFVGTDIGLRFKTTRGRGGVVENIYIKNINMKNIVGEAILFDMYYAAIDPIAMAGEKRAAPKTEMIPVSESTPQFKNIYIDNVVCNGADKAIFVRGLPEMSIKNINLSNIIVKANKGIDIQEGENITLKNISIDVPKADPLVFIQHSRNVVFDGLKYIGNPALLFSIYGERSKDIQVLNTNTKNAAQQVQFDYGADKKVFKVK